MKRPNYLVQATVKKPKDSSFTLISDKEKLQERGGDQQLLDWNESLIIQIVGDSFSFNQPID